MQNNIGIFKGVVDMKDKSCPKVRVLDCTLRDGGYHTKWHFTGELLKSYIDVMERSPVDAIELGFVGKNNSGYGYFASINKAKSKMICKDSVKFYAVMIDAKDFFIPKDSIKEKLFESLGPRNLCNIDIVRIAVKYSDAHKCAPICSSLQELGYRIFLNLMQVDLANEIQLKKCIESVKHLDKIEVIYLADSFGSMLPRRVDEMITRFKKQFSCDIGFHAHNNRGFALINSKSASIAGATWIDCTVEGIGRGAGNAATEQILPIISEGYSTDANLAIQNLCVTHFQPLRQLYYWGSNALYDFAAVHAVHPMYVQTLFEDDQIDEEFKFSCLKQLLGSKKYSSFDRMFLNSIIEKKRKRVRKANPDKPVYMSHLQISDKPLMHPNSPHFSSGPCKKFPGWSIEKFSTNFAGRSHRGRDLKRRLNSAIERSCSLLGVPKDWKVGIIPGSSTGAFETALWNLLGSCPVDVLVSDDFSAHWARDISGLMGENTFVHDAKIGKFPDTHHIADDNDVVFVYNGTSSGVCVPDLEWINDNRKGLVFCDAASAAFAMDIDFTKLDVVCWSWQKALGSEAAHGMLALSPKAQARIMDHKADWSVPKLFKLTDKNGCILDNLFKGHTISTPSLLALEDLHLALDWAESIGGVPELVKRTKQNHSAMAKWVEKTTWIDWLTIQKDIQSPASLCLRITDSTINNFEIDTQFQLVNNIIQLLEMENAAYDIWPYGKMPPGFRVWGGPTIDEMDITLLTVWLQWAYEKIANQAKPIEKALDFVQLHAG